MTEERWATAHLSEIDGPNGWAPIRRHFGIASFGVNAWTAEEAGANVISEHDEEPSGHEELYLVVAGRATFTVEGHEVDAPVGTVVHVREPGATRAATAAEPGTTVLAIGGRPGAAYEPRDWEINAEVLPLFERQEYGEAKRILAEAHEHDPDAAGLLYNLACAEARLGEHEPALEHLARAVELAPRFAEFAQGDDDLASLRGDPRFPAARPA
jgi:tetratricopeptide (TPR) repeat protein